MEKRKKKHIYVRAAALLLAAGLIVGGISCTLSRALFAALPKQAGQQRRGSPFQK